jgi:acyl-CoA thioester hydrolase
MKAHVSQMDESVYPFFVEISTRFGDMDINGHLNNVAYAQYFEDARVSFNRAVLFDGGWEGPEARDFRILVAGVDIAYVREGAYGWPIRVGIGVSRIGTSSWSLVAAVFQSGKCLAVHDAAIVFKGPSGALPESLRQKLAEKMLLA